MKSVKAWADSSGVGRAQRAVVFVDVGDDEIGCGRSGIRLLKVLVLIATASMIPLLYRF